MDLHDRLKPAVHLIEAAALGEALIADLRRIGANVLDVKPAGASKLARLEAQMHHIKGQRVQVLRNMPGLEVLLLMRSRLSRTAHQTIRSMCFRNTWHGRTSAMTSLAERSYQFVRRVLYRRRDIIELMLRANGAPRHIRRKF